MFRYYATGFDEESFSTGEVRRLKDVFGHKQLRDMRAVVDISSS